MPRIRTIKPEIWTSEDFMALTPVGKNAFIALITQADDEGRQKTTAAHLDAICLRTGAIAEVQEQLDQMEDQEMIRQYCVGRLVFVWLVNWEKHQKVQHPTPSTYPAPDDHQATPLRESSGHLRSAPEMSGQDTNPPAGSGVLNPSRARADRIGPDQYQDRKGGEGSVREGVSADADPAASGPIEEPVRIDVEQLCQRMVESVVERDEPRPLVTARWRRDARLLLDRDRRPLQEALDLVEWLTHDAFWRANVLGIPKFREQYGKLRLARERDVGRRGTMPRAVADLDAVNGAWDAIGEQYRQEAHGGA